MNKITQDGQQVAWHSHSIDEVLSQLETSREGLSQQEAEARLGRYGPNKLAEQDKDPAILRFLRQFNDVLIYVLLAAALLTAFLGEWIDTGVILAVVFINAIIGFIQEGRAESALESIRKMLSLEALVLREGERKSIPATELVPGDVVLLESGDRVPADLRVLSARNLRIEEAALTGESEPVSKQVEPLAEATVLAERSNMAYASTVVTSGRLVAVVAATAQTTEIGRIGELVARVETLTTPLLRAMSQFGKRLSAVIVLVAALVFVFGFFLRDFSLVELFMIVVSLAVAAIPEGLPAILTITLALGVQRMASRNAIIRRLPAVETLGSVSVICSDKTGTLTKNEMTVREVILRGESFEVTGSGYEPKGSFKLASKAVDPQAHSGLWQLLQAGFLCSDARLKEHDGNWRLEGDPTEGAVVALGMKAGLGRASEKAAPRLDVIPFESEHRFMATLHVHSDGHRIYLKGAPEAVLERCDFEYRQDGEQLLEPSFWEKEIERLAGKGYRVLAIATAKAPADKNSIGFSDVDNRLTLLGFVGMIDPPRPEAITAVKECQEAGIIVKMITGDHALTARTIGQQMGIGDGKTVMTGQELETLSSDELKEAARRCDIFARTSPEHKLRLVQALQAHGYVIAMTGDGVNDAPALKRADVGIAMGIKGSEAAKDAAEMVLADDNFSSIAEAVREGRSIYDNLKKTILFMLPTNGAEALVVIATVLFAFNQLPITPVQILWVNMITAVTLALTLAFEPAEPGIMRRPPRDPSEAIISGYLLWRIIFVACIIATLALVLFFIELEFGHSLESARTVAVNVLVAGQVFYLFNSRFIMQSSLSVTRLLSNRAALLAVGLLIIFQLMFTYLPIFQLWFGTAAIRWQDWGLVLLAGLLVFFAVELEKALTRFIKTKRGKKTL